MLYAREFSQNLDKSDTAYVSNLGDTSDPTGLAWTGLLSAILHVGAEHLRAIFALREHASSPLAVHSGLSQSSRPGHSLFCLFP